MQLGGIAADDLRAGCDGDVDAAVALVERRRHIGHDRCTSARDVAVDDVEGLLAGVEPGQPKEILDEPLHALAYGA